MFEALAYASRASHDGAPCTYREAYCQRGHSDLQGAFQVIQPSLIVVNNNCHTITMFHAGLFSASLRCATLVIDHQIRLSMGSTLLAERNPYQLVVLLQALALVTLTFAECWQTTIQTRRSDMCMQQTSFLKCPRGFCYTHISPERSSCQALASLC